MGWYDMMHGLRDRSWNSGEGRLGIASSFLFNTNTNYPEGDQKPDVAGTLFSIPSKWLVVVPFIWFLWLLAYVSGAFPYLGSYSYSRSGGAVGQSGGGLRHMLLFKGQTGFMEYEVDSASNDQGTVYFNISPFPGHLRGVRDAKHVRGKLAGVLEFRVPRTGVYTFDDGIGPEAGRENLSYSVVWGAR